MGATTLLTSVQHRLIPTSDTPHLDAVVLLSTILAKNRSWILAHPDPGLSKEEDLLLEKSLRRLEEGEPLPYVIGEWEFYQLSFFLTPDVLIPRPETELLVDHALAWLRANPSRRSGADVGTGSGCIAVTLAVLVPDLKITALDISPAALQVAERNAIRHGIEKRVNFLENDLLKDVEQEFDLVCANLPYIPSDVLKTLKVYGREPTLALEGGKQGLDFIAGLLADLPGHLALGGKVLLEIDPSQDISSRELAEKVFPEAEVRIIPDLAGHSRILSIQS